MMTNKRWTKQKVAGTAILALTLVAFVIFDEPSHDSNYLGRRSLQEDVHGVGETIRLVQQEQRRMKEEGHDLETTDLGYYEWAQKGLNLVRTPPGVAEEQLIFWHIPKSGGTTAKSFYQCMGLNMEVIAQPPDILKLRDDGFVHSGNVDMLFTSYPDYATKKLFDGDHRGRMLALFRHPVERLISKFYYLGKADWERVYHPEWKDLSIQQWVEGNHDTQDYEHHVKKLAGKTPFDTATEEDLELAKHTIRAYFVVGLTDQMEESIKRFNTFMKVDDTHVMDNEERSELCRNSLFSTDEKQKLYADKETNSNPHPKIDSNDPGYQLLAEKNPLDIQLYEYIQELFVEQKAIIESYATNVDAKGVMEKLPSQEETTVAAVKDSSNLQHEQPMDEMMDEQYGNADASQQTDFTAEVERALKHPFFKDSMAAIRASQKSPVPEGTEAVDAEAVEEPPAPEGIKTIKGVPSNIDTKTLQNAFHKYEQVEHFADIVM